MRSMRSLLSSRCHTLLRRQPNACHCVRSAHWYHDLNDQMAVWSAFLEKEQRELDTTPIWQS